MHDDIGSFHVERYIASSSSARTFLLLQFNKEKSKPIQPRNSVSDRTNSLSAERKTKCITMPTADKTHTLHLLRDIVKCLLVTWRIWVQVTLRRLLCRDKQMQYKALNYRPIFKTEFHFLNFLNTLPKVDLLSICPQTRTILPSSIYTGMSTKQYPKVAFYVLNAKGKQVLFKGKMASKELHKCLLLIS